MQPEEFDFVSRLFDLLIASLPTAITAVLGLSGVIYVAINGKKTSERMKKTEMETKKIEIGAAKEAEVLKEKSDLIDDLSTDLNNIRIEVRALRKELAETNRKYYVAQKYIFSFEIWVAQGMPTPPGPPERPEILDD